MNRFDTGLPMPGPGVLRLPQTNVCRIDEVTMDHNPIEYGVCEITCLHHLPERKHPEEVFALFGR